MDVPKGPLRQDAELGRRRREDEVFSEITNTTARSRWVDLRREEAFLPGAELKTVRVFYRLCGGDGSQTTQNCFPELEMTQIS